MKHRFDTREIAEGGVATALFLLLFGLHRLLPSADFFLNFIMSLLMCFVILRLGKRSAFLVYLATTLLAFIWPGPPDILGFVVVGGLYPFIKLISDRESLGRRFGRTASFIIKLGCGFSLGFIYFLIITKLFYPIEVWNRVMALPLAKLWVIPALLLAIYLYDYLLSQGVEFYFQRIKPLLGKLKRDT